MLNTDLLCLSKINLISTGNSGFGLLFKVLKYRSKASTALARNAASTKLLERSTDLATSFGLQLVEKEPGFTTLFDSIESKPINVVIRK
ncbi:hypothetical protein D3C87_1625200 [compost metagenome]